MSPSEIQELIEFEPFTPVRLTLASGAVVELRQREGLAVTGLSLAISDVTLLGEPRWRLVSIPNITLVEPLPNGRQRHRTDEGGEL